ncbi:MAG: energy-coupling factor transporter transmembrane protein EcfT [Spirochaetales bacterium]|nr:energy-coupling factor transporter transmembrane protein EcfT [Spirochaetales bacterium]
MADILASSKVSSNFLSKRDPRLKLIFLFLFSILAFRFSLLSNIIILPLITAGVMRTGFTLQRLIKSSFGFLIIIILPPALALIHLLQETTGQSLESASLFSLSLLNIYLFSILIIRSTGLRALQNGTSWFVSFIPFLSARKAGLMMGMTLSTLPRILVEWGQIRDAQKARGGDGSKNPVKRLTTPLLPLILNTILKAETTADALESRGFQEKESLSGKTFRKYISLGWNNGDSLLLFGGSLLLTGLVLIPYLF